MQKHVRILGWLFIALGVLDLLFGLLLFGAMSGLGMMAGNAQALGMMSALGGLLGTIMLVMALPNFLCGLGLLRNWGGWVIILACVLAFLNLPKFPWGTAVSIYTFWVAYKLYNAQEETPPAA